MFAIPREGYHARVMFERIRIGGNLKGEKRGDAPMVSLHLPPSMKKALTSFARRNGLNRSEAMRMFIETGLEAERKEKAA